MTAKENMNCLQHHIPPNKINEKVALTYTVMILTEVPLK